MIHIRMMVLALGSFLILCGNDAEAQHGPSDSHHAESLHHDFADAERWAAVFESEDRAGWQKPDHVVELMEIRPGMTIADLGAGTGYFLEYLQAAVGNKGKVLALDPEPELVEYMRKRSAKEGWTRVEAKRIPYDDPAIAEGTADRILIVDTWHHIENREAYSRKLKEAITEEGRVLIVDFTMQSPHGPPVKHRLPAEQVRRELQAGGLEAQIIDEDLPHQYVVVGRRLAAPKSSR